MEVLHARCCGLDVHKKTVVACLLTPGLGGEPLREVRTYGTTTGELLSELSAHIARSLLRSNVPLPGSEDKSAPLG
jgi:hypothetical protein